jgi:hypothetical protein
MDNGSTFFGGGGKPLHVSQNQKSNSLMLKAEKWERRGRGEMPQLREGRSSLLESHEHVRSGYAHKRITSRFYPNCSSMRDR